MASFIFLAPSCSCSEGTMSLLSREIEDMKSKLVSKTDELNEAIKSNFEVARRNEKNYSGIVNSTFYY